MQCVAREERGWARVRVCVHDRTDTRQLAKHNVGVCRLETRHDFTRLHCVTLAGYDALAVRKADRVRRAERARGTKQANQLT